MKRRKYWKRAARRLADELTSVQRHREYVAARHNRQVHHLESLLRDHGVLCKCITQQVGATTLADTFAVSRPQRDASDCPVHNFDHVIADRSSRAVPLIEFVPRPWSALTESTLVGKIYAIYSSLITCARTMQDPPGAWRWVLREDARDLLAARAEPRQPAMPAELNIRLATAISDDRPAQLLGVEVRVTGDAAAQPVAIEWIMEPSR
jgi:hypothetical protein